MSTRTPRVEDFCDMTSHDWPAELRELQRAALATRNAYYEIADLRRPPASDPDGRQEMQDAERSVWLSWQALERRGRKRLAAYATLPTHADDAFERIVTAPICGTCGRLIGINCPGHEETPDDGRDYEGEALALKEAQDDARATWEEAHQNDTHWPGY